jgi:DNA repair protein RadC
LTEQGPQQPRYTLPIYEVRLVKARRPLRLAEACVGTPESASRALHALIGLTDREHFACLFLNAANNVTGAHIAAVGAQSAIGAVDPRAIMRAAFLACARAMVVGHNHLSGDPSPSPEDLECTASLMRVGKVVGVPVIDHVIVTADPARYHSMFDRGTLPVIPDGPP